MYFDHTSCARCRKNESNKYLISFSIFLIDNTYYLCYLMYVGLFSLDKKSESNKSYSQLFITHRNHNICLVLCFTRSTYIISLPRCSNTEDLVTYSTISNIILHILSLNHFIYFLIHFCGLFSH